MGLDHGLSIRSILFLFWTYFPTTSASDLRQRLFFSLAVNLGGTFRG
jgi:hypothetical protein